MSKCRGCGGTGQEADYVGLEMKPVAVDCDHCGGSGEREDELRRLIQARGLFHQRAFEQETRAWTDELCQIEMRKPMPTILFPAKS